MIASGQKVYVCGRLRGMTRRSLGALSAAAGLMLTQRPAAANVIVLGRSAAGRVVSDAGELRLGFRLKPQAGIISERSFRAALGFVAAHAATGAYSQNQIERHTGLGGEQARVLSLFDVLHPVEGRFSYADLIVARAASRLHSEGVGFPKIISVALALEQRGTRLSNVRLAEAPWGELLQVVEGALAKIDGQLLLPLNGVDLDADEAFARAEESEQAGDLASAERWYQLAARLDSAEAVIPFNLGNVLDELNRPREAEIAYREAVARDPHLADAWYNLAILQEKLGKEDEALASYERAIAIEPQYADALHNAALLLMRRRNFAAALPLLERIKSMASADADEARRLAHLCRLEIKESERRA